MGFRAAFSSTTCLDTIGSHQFSQDKLQASVSADTFAAFRESITGGKTLNDGARNEIASAMAKFAIGLGATNFCHKYAIFHARLFVDLDKGKVVMER